MDGKNYRREANQFNAIKTNPASVPKKMKRETTARHAQDLQKLLDDTARRDSDVRIKVNNKGKMYVQIDDRGDGCRTC